MGINLKDIQTFHKLGLTPLESKIYLVSLSLGREKIERIALTAKTDRSNTNHVIKRLQDKGIMTKILGNPNVYEAIPLNEAIDTLLKLEEKQFSEIREKARELSNRINYSNAVLDPLEPNLQVFRRSKESTQLIVIRTCTALKRSFDSVLNAKTFVDGIINLSENQFDCLKRGVKYRIITQRLTSKIIEEQLRDFIKYPNFQIRFAPKRLGPEIGICDRKSAVLLLNPNVGMGESYALMTNHPDCIEIFQEHFDTRWDEAREHQI